ncbi:hypothetical protein RVU96_11110 [Bordetella avium]
MTARQHPQDGAQAGQQDNVDQADGSEPGAQRSHELEVAATHAVAATRQA